MPNEHKDHRKRLRERFLNNGLSDFQPHEVLELLLFFAIPQQDTNPIAHRLINHFGSLSAVLDADIESLVEIAGIKDYSACLLKLIPEISSYYYLDKVKGGEPFDTIEKIGEYCIYKFLKDDVESLSVMMFDANMRMIGFEKIAEGAECSVDVNFEILAKTLFRYTSANFILVHNHPGGDSYPSKEDVALTQQIYNAMIPFNKVLIEHLIVAGDRYTPLMQVMRYDGTLYL